MPLYLNIEGKILTSLATIAAGGRPGVIAIGTLTQRQMDDINAVRRGLNLHEIESAEVVYMGRHHHTSRSEDGYSLQDMLFQIMSAVCSNSVVSANKHMTAMQNPMGRHDGYGNCVYDRAVFELTVRKPRAELYSAIPKGDANKPHKK